jgi:hypothetical protein
MAHMEREKRRKPGNVLLGPTVEDTSKIMYLFCTTPLQERRVNYSDRIIYPSVVVAGARVTHDRNFALFPPDLLCVPVLESLK